MRLPSQSPPIDRSLTEIPELAHRQPPWQTQVLVCGGYVPQVSAIPCCEAGLCGTRDHEEHQR